MIGKLIPLLVAGGISVHSSDTLQARLHQVSNMAQSYVTKQRMSTILRSAHMKAAVGDAWTVKSDQQLRQWIRKNVRIETSEDLDPSLDAWGTPFRQKTDGKAIALLSAGPDLNFGTADDLIAKSN